VALNARATRNVAERGAFNTAHETHGDASCVSGFRPARHRASEACIHALRQRAYARATEWRERMSQHAAGRALIVETVDHALRRIDRDGGHDNAVGAFLEPQLERKRDGGG